MKKNHIETRLKFAKFHQTWDSQWRKIIFSDEKRFNLDGPDGFQYYWCDLRKKKEMYSKRISGGGSVRLWGEVGFNGKTPLAVLNGRINATRYQNIFSETLISFTARIVADNFVLKHNNAHIHMATTTVEWLSANKVSVLEWPACSPYLNPIENLWGGIARSVYSNRKRHSSSEELREAIFQARDNINLTKLQN